MCVVYIFQRLWYTDIVIYPWLTPKIYWSKKYYIRHHLVVLILRIHIQEIIDKIIESGLKKDSDSKMHRKCIQLCIHILEKESSNSKLQIILYTTQFNVSFKKIYNIKWVLRIIKLILMSSQKEIHDLILQSAVWNVIRGTKIYLISLDWRYNLYLKARLTLLKTL